MSGVSYIVSFYCRVKKGFFVGNLLFFVDNYVENLKIASTMFVPEISIPDQQITGRVNENALSRVLGNILSNAVKYSDGDLKIVLSEDGDIRISNHASGLSEVQAERLFDRFYTVNTARKSTGLGLSIAKALMEKMGGTITADYRENVLEICVSVQKL